MRLRDGCLLLGVLLLLTHTSHQQNTPKKKPNAKKDSDTRASAALEDLQQQINNIVEELNLLKEQQALQTVCLKGTKIPGKCFLVDTVKKRYHTANEDCIAKGGILSTPLSSDENRQLWLFLNSKNAKNGLVFSWRPVLPSFLGRTNSEGRENTPLRVLRCAAFLLN